MMKWQKTIALLLFSILLTSCATVEKSRFSGDHVTAKIRAMWTVCYMTSVRNQAQFPAEFHIATCDCMIDKSREKYKDSDYKKLGQEKLSEFYRKLHQQCQEEQGIPLKTYSINPA